MIPLLAWMVGVCLAGDPLVDGLVDELERSTADLELGDTPAPYFVGYDLFDMWNTSVEATLGGVVFRHSGPSRQLGVAVRVGTAEMDSANFDDNWRGDGFRQRNLVVGDDPMAARHSAWLETDLAYKEAIENLARRVAARARKATKDETPAFGPGEAQVGDQPGAEPVALDTLEPIAVRLSEVFLDHPEIEWSRVFTGAENGRRVLVDGLGTRVSKPKAEINVRAIARVRAEDGSWVTDHASWLVADPGQLPPIDEMVAETEAMAERLEAWKALPSAEEDYVGPVVFESDAAVELVRSLVVPALSGTPPKEKPPRGSRTVSFGGNGDGSAVRVKRRLLPAGFHVSDDPTEDPNQPSSYTWDDEGERAQAIQLVVDGVIRTHYASRTPSKEVPVSNGHARGYLGELLRGTASNTTVRADKGLSAKKMHKLALSQAAAYELDHYVAIRRVEDPGVASAASVVRFSLGGNDGPLRAPIVAVKVYADGREEPVRGLHFVGLDHRALRDIVGAGSAVHRRTLLVAPPGETLGSATGGLPTTLAVPDLLFSEVELASGGGAGEKPPALPSPLAQKD